MDRYQTEQEINRQLDPGEDLLWSGSPSPARFALAAGRTLYALTNRRAIIVSRVFATTVKSYTYGQMNELQRVEREDGSGDLCFANREVASRRGATVLKRVGFVGIPDVRSVEQQIRSRVQEQKAA